MKVSILFCDDVRIEQSGKHIVVGVYPADLVPPTIPSVITLAVYIRVEGLASGSHTFKLRLLPPKEINPLVVEGTGQNADDPVSIIVAGLPLEIQEPGQLQARISFDEGKEFTIGELRIAAPLSSSAAPQPPSEGVDPSEA